MTPSSFRLNTQWRRETEFSLMKSRLEASRPTGTSPAGSTNTESLSGPQTATILEFTAPPLNEQSYVARSSDCEHIVPLLVPISEQIVGLSVRIVFSGAESC